MMVPYHLSNIIKSNFVDILSTYLYKEDWSWHDMAVVSKVIIGHVQSSLEIYHVYSLIIDYNTVSIALYMCTVQ